MLFYFFLICSTAEDEKVISVQGKSLEKFKKKNKIQDKKLIRKYKSSIERQQDKIKRENNSSETTLVSIIRKVLARTILIKQFLDLFNLMKKS